VMATEEGQRVAWRADTHGLLCLSEHQQLIHMEKVCALCVEQADALRRAYPPMSECDENTERGVDHLYPSPALVDEECCYECGDYGTPSPRVCHDGLVRILCTPCWYGHYMH
jgi:hypothetical protein